MEVVEKAGTSFAFPTRTLFLQSEGKSKAGASLPESLAGGLAANRTRDP
jgi:hypothetical protein